MSDVQLPYMELPILSIQELVIMSMSSSKCMHDIPWVDAFHSVCISQLAAFILLTIAVRIQEKLEH